MNRPATETAVFVLLEAVGAASFGMWQNSFFAGTFMLCVIALFESALEGRK